MTLTASKNRCVSIFSPTRSAGISDRSSAACAYTNIYMYDKIRKKESMLCWCWCWCLRDWFWWILPWVLLLCSRRLANLDHALRMSSFLWICVCTLLWSHQMGFQQPLNKGKCYFKIVSFYYKVVVLSNSNLVHDYQCIITPQVTTCEAFTNSCAFRSVGQYSSLTSQLSIAWIANAASHIWLPKLCSAKFSYILQQLHSFRIFTSSSTQWS